MAKYKKLTDREIVAAVDQNVHHGVGYLDSKLSREREQVLKYYHGELPKPHHSGNSKYVSMDVYDTVESAKSQLIEVFSAGDGIVEFAPQGPEDVGAAKVATAYTDYVLFRQNPGVDILTTVLTDGLMARNGVAKVYWETKYNETEESFEALDADELAVLLEDPELTLETYVDNEDGTFDGTLVRRKDVSQVRIDPVPPEEFLISPRAKSIREAPFVAQRVLKTEAELIEMGFDRKVIQGLATDDSIINEEEKHARFSGVDEGSTMSDIEYQQQARKLQVIEAYIRLDVDGEGRQNLWKVTKCGSTLLDKQRVSRVPFVAFVPLPLPHSWWGANFATKAIPIQNARTVLMRGILDHTVITNNPRMMVVKGALVNPREMLENRIGGIVNVTRPDGVFPLQQASLNPFVFQTIQLLDEDKEDTTGVSKISQGLNKDAISKQNSQGMVEQLVGLSQQRQKIVARNFANQFLKELYVEIYGLVLENEKQEKVIEIAGQWVPIDPSKWYERTDISVSMHLGYGEKDRQANECIQLHQLLGSDPAMSNMYTDKQRYNLISKYMVTKGYKNVDDYLIPPEQAQPKQPDPMMVHEMEMDKAKLQLEQQKLQLAAQKNEMQAQMDMMRQEFMKSQEMLKLLVEQRNADRKDFEAKTRADTAERELDIVEKTKPAEVKQSNIISPNS